MKLSKADKQQIGAFSILIFLFLVLINNLLPYAQLTLFNILMLILLVVTTVAQLLIQFGLWERYNIKQLGLIASVIICLTFFLNELSSCRLKRIEPLLTATAEFTINLEASKLEHNSGKPMGVYLNKDEVLYLIMENNLIYTTHGAPLVSRIDIHFELLPKKFDGITVDMIREKKNIIFALDIFKEKTKIKGGYCRFVINGNAIEVIEIPEQIISKGGKIYPNLE